MSGGSYNYLYLNVPELGGHREHLEAMAARLDGLPYAAKAAAATRQILAVLDDEALAGVWQAVEWWDSADYSEDQVREAVAEYEEHLKRG